MRARPVRASLLSKSIESDNGSNSARIFEAPARRDQSAEPKPLGDARERTGKAKSHRSTILVFTGASESASFRCTGDSALTAFDDLGSLDLDDERAAGDEPSAGAELWRLSSGALCWVDENVGPFADRLKPVGNRLRVPAVELDPLAPRLLPMVERWSAVIRRETREKEAHMIQV